MKTLPSSFAAIDEPKELPELSVDAEPVAAGRAVGKEAARHDVLDAVGVLVPHDDEAAIGECCDPRQAFVGGGLGDDDSVPTGGAGGADDAAIDVAVGDVLVDDDVAAVAQRGDIDIAKVAGLVGEG